jgi:hypothetical protein
MMDICEKEGMTRMRWCKWILKEGEKESCIWIETSYNDVHIRNDCKFEGTVVNEIGIPFTCVLLEENISKYPPVDGIVSQRYTNKNQK